MTPAQARRIGAHADLIMWDVLSGDYALDVRHAQEVASAQARLQRRTKPGSVVVFHDSAKHASGLKALLPDYLTWLSRKGSADEGDQPLSEAAASRRSLSLALISSISRWYPRMVFCACSRIDSAPLPVKRSMFSSVDVMRC